MRHGDLSNLLQRQIEAEREDDYSDPKFLAGLAQYDVQTGIEGMLSIYGSPSLARNLVLQILDDICPERSLHNGH